MLDLILGRASGQPELRRPEQDQVEEELRAAFARWETLAKQHSQLDYEEYSLAQAPARPVVLGDPQHLTAQLDVVFRNAPQSLREVEPTTGFKV